jgi:hypothetical protein
MKYRFLLLVFVLATLGAEELLCQSRQPPGPPPSAARASSGPSLADSFGVGVKVSTLGVGAEIAARVARRANVRAGFNILGYSRTFNKDGIPYDGHLDFRTVEGHLDVFPWTGNFHVSSGVLGYIGDPITAHASVPGGQSFTLGGVAYYSDATNPVTGGGKIDFNQAAPMVTVGWGNLIPRRHRHFSVPFELGVAFQGSPKATLTLQGSVCDPAAANCRTIASDPTVQGNILSEQNKLNNSMSVFKAYPVISVGFGYRF